MPTFQALYKAINDGDYEAVEAIITRQEAAPASIVDRIYRAYDYLFNHINGVNAYGFSPLVCAVIKGDLRIARLLCEHGADINQRVGISADLTALHYAIMNKHPAIVRYLIERGVDLSIEDEYKNTYLHTAVFYGASEEIVRILLDNYPADILIRENKKGYIPLSMAIGAMRENSLALVKLLFTEEAAAKIKEKHGLSALSLALKGDFKMRYVPFLIEQCKDNQDLQEALEIVIREDSTNDLQLVGFFQYLPYYAMLSDFDRLMILDRNIREPERLYNLKLLLANGASIIPCDNKIIKDYMGVLSLFIQDVQRGYVTQPIVAEQLIPLVEIGNCSQNLAGNMITRLMISLPVYHDLYIKAGNMLESAKFTDQQKVKLRDVILYAQANNIHESSVLEESLRNGDLTTQTVHFR